MNTVHTLSDLTTENKEGTRPTELQKERNTNRSVGFNCQRKSAWGFTLNNYTKKDINRLQSRKFTFQNWEMEIKKYIFQEEIGESGTLHLQGCVYFKNRVSGACLKALLPRAHWKPSQNWNALMNYCSKEFTRNGKIYRYGCVENRIKNKETPEEKDIRWSKYWELQKDALVKATCAAIKELCLEVGHAEYCGCKKK